MKRLFFSIIFLFTGCFVNAQDLNARVQVLSPLVQNTNKRPLEVLETAIREFLNNRKWSTDALLSQERIDCNFVIKINEWDGSSNFKAEAQIQSSRPVYGSSYNSTIINLSDRNFDFNYSEGQPLDFSEQQYISNLTSLLAFYANIIVGLDYDTFSKFGGSAYYTKAQAILNVAQNAPYNGWKAFEDLRNRFWLIENLTNKSFNPIHETLYTYHKNGLDVMAESASKGRKVIAGALPDLLKIDKQKQGSVLNQVFFTSKSDEIVNIFSKADAQEKIKMYNLLVELDPPNISKYELLKK